MSAHLENCVISDMLDPTCKAKSNAERRVGKNRKVPDIPLESGEPRKRRLSPQPDSSRLEEEHRGQIDDGFRATLVTNDAAIQCFTALGIRLFFLTGEQPTTTGDGLERRIDKVDDEIYPPCICIAIVLATDRHSYISQHLDPRNG